MSGEPALEPFVERLRENLRLAGILFAEEDVRGIVERGFLEGAALFEEIVQRSAADPIPDYVAHRETAADAILAPARSEWRAPDPGATAPRGPARGAGPASGAGRHMAFIAEASGLIRDRVVSPVELTREALDRIAERDPQINAFQLITGEEALSAARQAEEEIASGEHRGPLHGVPVAVKDLLAMRGTPTTAGSKMLAENRTDYDAAAVERLRAAGAVITGKTRLSEFAYSPGSNNAGYGPTRNPWNTERDSGGSSSGSAAAVADGMVYGALGSDTGGSIRIPSSLCGVVGLKPTYGRVSLFGAVPLSWSLDHLGPITRSVEDAALMLAALAGYDPRDPRTARGTEWAVPAGLDSGVDGLRIGALRDDGSGRTLGAPEAMEAWRSGLAALERHGAALIEVDLPEINDLRTLNGVILAIEAVTYHERRMRARLHEYGEFMRYRLLAAHSYSARAFIHAQGARGALRGRMSTLWDRVDLLSTPTQPYGALPLGTPASTAFTASFNILGWPAITVPVGLTEDRLPLGLQLVGRPWDEATVLRAARVVEAAGPWRDQGPADTRS